MCDVIEKDKCCGCSACYAVCPVRAIVMSADNKGFSYPHIDIDKCIHCNKCMNICPQNKENINEEPLTFLMAKNREPSTRMASSSGGVFSIFAKYVIEHDGVVYGASYDEDFGVVHAKASDESWKAFCGSKYVQSDLKDTYVNVERDLRAEKIVLFSGTPCQIAGLNSYLKIKNIPVDKLISIDVVCHGVPSPNVWKDWLKLRFHGKTIRKVSFRDKTKYGWHDSTLTVEYNKKSVYRATQMRGMFFKLFFSHYILRPACFKCQYSNFKRQGDFSLGDYWGIENHYPEFDDNKGVSIVMLNSKRAIEIWLEIKNMVEACKIKKDECLQPNLIQPSKKPKRYDEFWLKYSQDGIIQAAKMVGIEEYKGVNRFVHKITAALQKLKKF